MTSLNVRLLGEPRFTTGDGEEISITSRKSLALLAYLLLRPGSAHTRDELVGLLWGDRFDRQGRQSLRQALYGLRKQLGPDNALDIHGESVTVDRDRVAVDVWELERLAAAGDEASLEQAAALYQAPFFSGVTVREPGFEDWQQAQRERLLELHCDVLYRLAKRYKARGALDAALRTALRLVELNPLSERSHRLVMRLHAKAGNRAEAVRQFRRCGAVLRRELSLDPDPWTRQVYERLRAGGAGPPGPDTEDDEGDERDEGAAPAAAPDGTGRIRRHAPAGRPPASGRPGIAVLAFEGLSGDPQEALLADGVASDLITGLSRLRWLRVIARNSSFSYRGRPTDTLRIGEELDVRYLVEGSVLKSGERIRISARLIAAESGNALWTERYDSEVSDLFDLQDEITQTIIGALEPELGEAEMARARRQPPASLDSWTCYQRALWHAAHFTREGLAAAEADFAEAIRHDPEFAPAYAERAYLQVLSIVLGFTGDPDASLRRAGESARRAIALDPRDAAAHFALGRVLILEQDFKRAIDEMQVALAHNPNAARAYFGLGVALIYAGLPEESIPEIEHAIQLSPRDPNIWGFLTMLSRAHFNAGDYAQAVDWARKAIRVHGTHFWPFAHCAAGLGKLGRIGEARAMLAEALSRNPAFSAELVRETVGRYGAHSGAEEIIEGLRLAGLES